MVLFEHCVDDVDAAFLAVEQGADRIELCDRLDLDGLTPERVKLRALVGRLPAAIHCMIRSRPGDFHYDRAEIAAMEAQVDAAKALGAHGIVLGALDGIGRIDGAAMAALMERAGPLPVTFHRAFDVTPDPIEALETLVELGVRRVLTSGQAPTAWKGRAMLRRLVEAGGERIVILAGGGVRSDHAEALVAETGVTELHASVALRGRRENTG